MKPVLAVSIGDYNGIGPEVILKTFFPADNLPFIPLVLGHPAILDFYNPLGTLPVHYAGTVSAIRAGRVNVMAVDEVAPGDIKPGTITKQAGLLSMKAVEKGIALCAAGEASALVTAPISKEAINRAGYNVPGHTEFLARETNCKAFVMMLVTKSLRVGLVSTHIPLKEVAATITRAAVLQQLTVMNRSLSMDFGLNHPKIAVLGLNPHAGDGGVLGDEETEIIIPAIREASSLNIRSEGPFPADGFFGSRAYEGYDAILAMYHDQGLIPFKTLSFGGGVNFTAGLPIIRTSPDHGTAFSIAGRGMANNQSFREAVDLAWQLIQNKVTTAK
ncbi:MAG: 4-hydroxythreonine-4-phosphate dehydrogenase PdxA [Balneolales bacterium]